MDQVKALCQGILLLFVRGCAQTAEHSIRIRFLLAGWEIVPEQQESEAFGASTMSPAVPYQQRASSDDATRLAENLHAQK
jgi:hypothetical protein